MKQARVVALAKGYFQLAGKVVQKLYGHQTLLMNAFMSTPAILIVHNPLHFHAIHQLPVFLEYPELPPFMRTSA